MDKTRFVGTLRQTNGVAQVTIEPRFLDEIKEGVEIALFVQRKDENAYNPGTWSQAE